MVKEVSFNKSNLWSSIPRTIALLMAAFQIFTGIFGIVATQSPIHLTFGLVLAFIYYSMGRKKEKKIYYVVDGIFLALALSSGLYLILNHNALQFWLGAPPKMAVFMSVVMVLVVLEMARRIVGPALPILAVLALLYGFFGRYVPGPFQHPGLGIERLFTSQYLGTEGIFSAPLGTTARFIILFIIFGALMQATEIGKYFIDIANSLVGKYRGGPAKVAVLSSSLMATISGSGTANVVTTGTFTIPLMKATGYKDYFAGAVEATASAGGQLTPPIMGAGAFIMAEMLGVSYAKVVAAAAIPALLFYVSVFNTVHLEAVKSGLAGLPKEQIPAFKPLWRKVYLLIPVLVLVYALVIADLSAARASVFGLGAIVVLGLFQKDRMSLASFCNAVEKGIKSGLVAIAACATAGIIIGVVTTTGISLQVASSIVQAAGGYLFLTLLLVAITCIVLGTGMPTTAAYVIMAIVAAPALKQLGVSEFSAHMFVYFLSGMSPITPPVAIDVYAAAALAGSNFWKTGLAAVRLALPGFIIPFVFVYSPVLLMQGSAGNIALALGTGVIGVMSLGFFVQGYFLNFRLSLVPRLMQFAAAFLLIIPGWMSDVLGLSLLLAGFMLNQFLSKVAGTKLQAQR